MRIGATVRKVKGRPLGVLAFRGLQEAQLALLRQTKGWTRIEDRARRWWNNERVAAFAAERGATTVLAPDAGVAIVQAVDEGALSRAGLIDFGTAAASRNFSVFGVPVPAEGPWPWHEDWRFGHQWQRPFWRDHDFYEARQVPYDVKFPWELSRLFFLPRVLQAASLAPAEAPNLLRFVESVLIDWEQENPMAGSIAWYPMEVSMRILALVVTLDMLRLLGPVPESLLEILLRALSTHGEFVWRNREYSELRGNHYAANVAALAAAGAALEHSYPNALQWSTFARETAGAEILRQFLADGVHFEKALGYQRLVVELFLFTALTSERRGTPLPSAALERLHVACRYLAECVRPDGLTPKVGDDDDGRVFHFDLVPAADVGPTLATARLLWSDPALVHARAGRFASPVWFMGLRAIREWADPGAATPATPSCRHFSSGGVVVARNRNNFFWMDVGEVGLHGHGGHGHNDLLSFELVWNGHAVFVDPGSYVYTADPVLRDLFRGSAYHNGLTVDHEEIAPMQGMWRIGSQAQPGCVQVHADGPKVRICAGHSGYARLVDPVVHGRNVRIDWQTGNFEVVDDLRCSGIHSTVRALHLARGMAATMDECGAVISDQGSAWRLTWNLGARAVVEDGWVSPSYAVRQPAVVLRLVDQIQSNAQLWLALRPFQG